MVGIQQHGGVVVDVAGSRQGFARLLREREGGGGGGVGGVAGPRQGCAELLREREREVLQGRREAPKAVGCCPPSPLYIGPLGRGGRPKPI